MLVMSPKSKFCCFSSVALPVESQANQPRTELPPSDDSPVESGVSVVFFHDEIHQESLIRSAQQLFAAKQIPVELLCVRPSGPRITPLSGSPNLQHVPDYQSALHKAKFAKIVFADPAYRFQSEHWDLLESDSVKSYPVRSLALASPKPPASRRLLAWTFAFLAWFLLRVKKHRLRPGIIVAQTDFLKTLGLDRASSQTADTPMWILALARWSHDSRINETQPVTECELGVRSNLKWTRQDSGPPNFPRSRSLRKSISSLLRFWFTRIAFPAREKFKPVHPAAPVLSRRTRFALSALVILSACILVLTNRGYPLFEPDEARNAQLALNVAESGNWLSLNLYGNPYTDKPPLMAWLTACCHWMFGASEATSRLPSAIAAIVTVCLTLLVGRRLVGFRSALAGTAALIVSWGFVFQARFVTMDMLLGCCTTAAILLGMLALRRSASTKRTLIMALAGVATGLGIMAKGPVAVVIVMPILALAIFVREQLDRRERKSLVLCWLVPTVVVGLPWFIIATIQNPAFAYDFVWKHHVVRFSDAFIHKEPFWYYGVVLWIIMFPTSIVLPRVFQFLASPRQKFRAGRTPEHGVLALGALWIVAFFSMSECKLPAYILPAFPLMALLCGVAIEHWLFGIGINNKQKRRSFHRLPKRIAIGMSLMTATLAGVILYRFTEFRFGNIGIAIFALLITGLLFIAVRRSARPASAWAAAAAICAMFAFLVNNQFVPSLGFKRSILYSIKQSGIDADTPLVYFGRDSHAHAMYLADRDVVHVKEENIDEMNTLLGGCDSAIVVASDQNIHRLEEANSGSLVVKPQRIRHTFLLLHRDSIRTASPEQADASIQR